MNGLPQETRDFLTRDALHDAASSLAKVSALLLAGAYIASPETLRLSVVAGRETMLEIIRLQKLLKVGEASDE